jgi:hypothetical protein
MSDQRVFNAVYGQKILLYGKQRCIAGIFDSMFILPNA